jgi:hypothetical protein
MSTVTVTSKPPLKKKPSLLRRLFSSHSSLRPSKSNLPSISSPVITNTTNERVSRVVEAAERERILNDKEEGPDHHEHQQQSQVIKSTPKSLDPKINAKKRSSFLAAAEVTHRLQGVSGSIIMLIYFRIVLAVTERSIWTL